MGGFIFVIIILLSFPLYAINLNCLKYERLVKQYHYYYFGIDFPYWYSIAQIEKESSCRHNIYSSDGIGSYGLAQITWKFWKDRLKKAGIPEIKSVKNNLKAQAYINYLSWKGTPKECKRLWVMYQIYNGGYWVVKEMKRLKERYNMDKLPCHYECAKISCFYCKEFGFKKCRKKIACKINYYYSKKIFKLGEEYKLKIKINNYNKNKYPFW